MKDVQLILIGGFLGAGKTTAILSLAESIRAGGKKVAVITNDQTADLVDTELVRQKGFPTLEVNKGCFCCNFYDFAHCLRQLREEHDPDVILAEPVGSCTDLLSTIMKPIRDNRADAFSLSPLSVLVDPLRLDALSPGGSNPFRRAEVSYLFLKQLEEADLIVLNKIDTLSAEQRSRYLNLLPQNFPSAKVLAVSAKTGEGMADWLSALGEFPAFDRPSPDIVYDTYAAAEAALGWLNTSATLSAPAGFQMDPFLLSLGETIQNALREGEEEIAHLKLCAVGEQDFAKISCVGLDRPVSLDRKTGAVCDKANLILNIRAACPPERLQSLSDKLLAQTAADWAITLSDLKTDCFAPSYPNPVFRI